MGRARFARIRAIVKGAKTTEKSGLVSLLHELEQRLPLVAVEELIRLVASPHFHAVTDREVRSISEYDCIEIEGERYFERAFSPGKEAASSLALARWIGPERVLADLRQLHAGLVAANPA